MDSSGNLIASEMRLDLQYDDINTNVWQRGNPGKTYKLIRERDCGNNSSETFIFRNMVGGFDFFTATGTKSKGITIGGMTFDRHTAFNSLDKDFDTQWASNGTADPSGFSIIIYDLKGAFDLDLVDIATTNGKTYYLQIWVSSTGTADGDFTNAFPPDNVDLVSNTDASFKSFILPSRALGTKYVKLIGKGQASSTFTTIHEIEFYGDSSTLSLGENDLANQIKLYPNPAKDFVTLKNIRTNVNLIQVFSVDGRKVLEKTIKSSESVLLQSTFISTSDKS